MDSRFCFHCGEKLTTKVVDDRKRHVCPACGYVQYLNPVPATAVTIIQDGQILLVKRAVDPRKGLWSLPAGFLEIDETVEECAVREVKEETNLGVQLTGLLAAYSVFDDPRYVCLLVVYMGKIVGGQLQYGDDASDAQFFPQSALPELAFKVHRRAIDLAFERARSLTKPDGPSGTPEPEEQTGIEREPAAVGSASTGAAMSRVLAELDDELDVSRSGRGAATRQVEFQSDDGITERVTPRR